MGLPELVIYSIICLLFSNSFGVCCVFLVTSSGTTINQNNTYIQNPGFSTAYSATTALTYTINKCAASKLSSFLLFVSFFSNFFGAIFLSFLQWRQSLYLVSSARIWTFDLSVASPLPRPWLLVFLSFFRSWIQFSFLLFKMSVGSDLTSKRSTSTARPRRPKPTEGSATPTHSKLRSETFRTTIIEMSIFIWKSFLIDFINDSHNSD